MMMKGKDLLSFYLFIKKLRVDIIKIFGGVPLIDERVTKHMIPLKWSRNKRLVDVTTAIVVFVDKNIQEIKEPHLRVAYLIRDHLYLSSMSSLSNFYKTASIPLVPTTIFNPVMKLTNQIFEMILFPPHRRIFINNRNKVPYSVKDGMLKCVYNKTFDKTFFNKNFTTAKRGVGLLQNAIITTRYYDALKHNDIYRNVSTDVNFCKRVAIMEQIVNGKIPFMTLDSLNQAIDLLYNRITAGTMNVDLDHFVPKSALDSDLIYLMSQFKVAQRSRCMTKAVELMPVDCTCHLKCRGPIYGKPHLNKLIDQLYKTTHATKVCGLCRLSFSVENTTSAKPKKYITPINPAISSCSFDGCTTSFISQSQFYNQIGEGPVYEMGHRAFMTNSLAVTDPVYKKTVSTATGRTYTTCLSGSRTCTRGFIKVFRSARHMGFEYDFKLLEKCWRCSSCAYVRKYDPDSHEFFNEDIHKQSCIGIFYSKLKHKDLDKDIPKYAEKMCLPCRMVCLCRHSLQGLSTRMKRILQANNREEAPERKKKKIPKYQAERGLGELLKQERVLIKLQRYLLKTTTEWRYRDPS
uniref:ORF62 n=1 Tax=Malaco herpesvirus 1 TaxID=3031797 RepID=A0AA48SF28_9VIRU|nr:TPA_asm: ORF62 [Malaco herpesvirus 1]